MTKNKIWKTNSLTHDNTRKTSRAECEAAYQNVILSECEESHNSLCSLFLFNFDAKRCYARRYATNKSEIGKYSKEKYSNGTSHQGLCPRTTILSYEILRFARALNGYGFQSLLVRPQYDNITNTNDKKGNKNVKNLLPYSLNALLPKKRFAFTLAEVLITLGIIGIVAAMTIPTLITNYRAAVTKSKLKKTISVMSQAAQLTKEKYDFDFSSLDQAYYDPVGGSCIDDPQKVKSFCSLFNASLSNATYLGYSRSLYNITPAVTPRLVPYGTGGTSRHQAYILSDGVIVAIEMDIVPKNCELLVGETINSDWITSHKACIGYIDVNGEKKPNKEVSCSDTTTEFKPNEPCFVKKDQTHMTDIYPVIFHDSMVEPATNAAAFVMKN